MRGYGPGSELGYVYEFGGGGTRESEGQLGVVIVIPRWAV